MSCEISVDNIPCLSFRWSGEEQEINLEFERQGFALLRFNDTTQIKSVTERYEKGEQFTVTQEQAETALRRFMQIIGQNAGDWRVREAKLGIEPQDQHTWKLWLHRHHHEMPCLRELIYARVDPYQATIETYFAPERAILIPQTSPLIREEQARQIAKAAFRQGGGADIEPRMLFPTAAWLDLSLHSPLSRLGYQYSFDVKDEMGQLQGGVECRIDAQTGELWWIAWVTGGGSAASKIDFSKAKPSARFAVGGKLLADKTTQVIGEVMLSGQEQKTTAKYRGAAIKAAAGNQTVHLGFEAKQRLLWWSRDGQDWYAVQISKADAKRVAVWQQVQTRKK